MYCLMIHDIVNLFRQLCNGAKLAIFIDIEIQYCLIEQLYCIARHEIFLPKLFMC